MTLERFFCLKLVQRAYEGELVDGVGRLLHSRFTVMICVVIFTHVGPSSYSSPGTPVQVDDTPDTPPTPPTVRQRKAAVAVRPSAGFSSAGVISESSSSQPVLPSERTGERQTLSRTRSLPPVPRLELTRKEICVYLTF